MLSRFENSMIFSFLQNRSMSWFFYPFRKRRMTDSPSDFPLPRTSRSVLSPAARSLRLQRIFARLQDGAAYADIAAGGLFTRAAAADHPRGDDSWSRPRRAGPQADADRSPDAGSAPCRGPGGSGRRKIHPALVEDYRPTRPLFRPAPGFQLVLGVDGSAASSILEARKSRQDETRLRRRRPRRIRRGGFRLPLPAAQALEKTFKTARASYWLKLAWIWDPRRRRGGLS
jgi:hypothetical protein